MSQIGDITRAESPPLDGDQSDGRFNPLLLATVAVAVFLLFVLVAALMYRSVYAERIYLGVSAGGIALEGYSADQARAALAARYDQYARTTLPLRFGQQEWKATPAEMGMRFDVEETVKSAYAVGREGGFLGELRAQLDAWRQGETARQPLFRLDPTQRGTFFDRLAKEINQQPVDARLTLLPSEFKVRVSPSAAGRALNVEQTVRKIEQAIAVQSTAPIDLVVDDLPAAVVENDLQPTKELAEKMMSAPLVAQFGDLSLKVERDEIAELVTLRQQKDGNPKASVELADQPLQRLVARLAKAVNRQPFNARFDYAGGNLKVIREGIDGRTLDVPATVAAIKVQLAQDERTVALPVKVTKPAIGSGDAAKLQIAGIVEQASTEYGYPGALPERTYNVELAASRLHGVVIAPGEEFSFNDQVGPVNTLSGYKTGFGITQEGGNAVTVSSVGGGICQVATTLFHATFSAGYDIGTRVTHLYWIPRYGLPPKSFKGLDTTIDQIYDKDGNLSYAVDSTFTNNSPYPLLIQSKTDGRNLTFTILGTKPGWEVKVDGPAIDNVVPAIGGTVRQEDPAWPAGQSIVIEEARDGFRATFTRTVTKDGKLVDRHKFVSEYVPTRNVILIGTGGKPAGPTTVVTPQPSATPVPTPGPQPTPAQQTTPVATPAPSPTAGRR